MELLEDRRGRVTGELVQSEADFIRMMQMVQKGGAADFEYISIGTLVGRVDQFYQAERVGWVDVPSQPEFKGEWVLFLGI